MCAQADLLMMVGRYMTMRTRVTASDSPEFYADAAVPAVRVGGESSLEWAPTFQGAGAGGGSPREPSSGSADFVISVLGGAMSLIDHSVLEVPSGGFSWVVEQGSCFRHAVVHAPRRRAAAPPQRPVCRRLPLIASVGRRVRRRSRLPGAAEAQVQPPAAGLGTDSGQPIG